MIQIDNKEILQINSAIIAGALIFLTLSSIAPTQVEQFYRVSSILFGVLVIIAFSISSLRALNDKKDQALFVMEIGFVLLIAGSIGYAVSNYEAYFKGPDSLEVPFTKQSKSKTGPGSLEVPFTNQSKSKTG